MYVCSAHCLRRRGGKESFLQIVGICGHPYRKKMIHDPFLTLFTKNDLDWIIDLRVKAETVKFLRENLGENVFDLGVGKDSLAGTQIFQPRKGGIDHQLDCTLKAYDLQETPPKSGQKVRPQTRPECLLYTHVPDRPGSGTPGADCDASSGRPGPGEKH